MIPKAILMKYNKLKGLHKCLNEPTRHKWLGHLYGILFLIILRKRWGI